MSTIREQLAEALPAELGPVGLRSTITGESEPTGYGNALLDVLAPLVDRLAAERAASELENAADWLWDDNGPGAAAYHHLTACAAALRTDSKGDRS